MTEEWRKIEEFPNYAVSNLGRVKRILTCKGKPLEGRVLSPYVGWGRSRMVNLSDKGVSHTMRISTLVAKAFLPNPNSLQVVVHKDGNILNDNMDNLQWVSRSELSSLSSNGKKISESRKIPVIATDPVTSNVKVFPSLIDAVSYLKSIGHEKAAPSHICECCRNRLKSAYGFRWSYVKEEEDGSV